MVLRARQRHRHDRTVIIAVSATIVAIAAISLIIGESVVCPRLRAFVVRSIDYCRVWQPAFASVHSCFAKVAVSMLLLAWNTVAVYCAHLREGRRPVAAVYGPCYINCTMLRYGKPPVAVYYRAARTCDKNAAPSTLQVFCAVYLGESRRWLLGAELRVFAVHTGKKSESW